LTRFQVLDLGALSERILEGRGRIAAQRCVLVAITDASGILTTIHGCPRRLYSNLRGPASFIRAAASNEPRFTLLIIEKEETKVFTKLISLTAGLILCLSGIASANGSNRTKFTVRIENITKPDAFTASNGVKWSLAFSPGLAVVHTDKAPIFTAGKNDRGKGLEAQSEDGNPDMLAKSL
jgi:hypothetical protein